SRPKCPPCWINGPRDLPDCYDKIGGKCPSWRGIYEPNLSRAVKLNPKLKPSGDKPVYNVQPNYEEKAEPTYSSDCILPKDENIVPITPHALNRGWAMSPDQRCSRGTWCPYACNPGMYSAQFDSSSSASTMAGGLFCNQDAKLVKPFPNRPLCKPGVGTVYIDNRLGEDVAVCQTVYPGNEAMLIPTVAPPNELQIINTPPVTYWRKTSAHYYINPPTLQAKTANGAPIKPRLGTGPRLFDINGNTFITVAINPQFKHPTLNFTPFKVDIQCVGRCNNPTCQATLQDPSGKSCTTTVLPGSHARIVLSR
ncbi:hypothetical protein L0F63_001154, partial [Massospora cicadina]